MSALMSDTALSHPLDVEAIRQDFPILHKPLPSGLPLVYLDNAATAQKPRAVIQKLVEVYENYNSNVHRGIHALGDRVTTELENAREIVRAFIRAPQSRRDRLHVRHNGVGQSCGAGVGAKVSATGRRTAAERDGTSRQSRALAAGVAQEREATLRFIPLTADGRLDLSALDDVLTERTKLVAVTGMSNVLGTINPIRELAGGQARDGADFRRRRQSVPHANVNVHNPNVDFLAFSGHKIFGPSGIGVLYGRHKLLESMSPYMSGGNMIQHVRKESSDFADLPNKFEAGTLPIAQAIGLGTALEYVTAVGFDSILQHERQLTARAMEQLSAIPGLRILGPALEHRGGIVSFTVEGVHPHDMAELLDRRGVAVRAGHHCTMPLHDLLQVNATTRTASRCTTLRQKSMRCARPCITRGRCSGWNSVPQDLRMAAATDDRDGVFGQDARESDCEAPAVGETQTRAAATRERASGEPAVRGAAAQARSRARGWRFGAIRNRAAGLQRALLIDLIHVLKQHGLQPRMFVDRATTRSPRPASLLPGLAGVHCCRRGRRNGC